MSFLRRWAPTSFTYTLIFEPFDLSWHIGQAEAKDSEYAIEFKLFSLEGLPQENI